MFSSFTRAPGTGRKDISTFIIEKSFPGFRVGKKLKKFGMRGSPTSELILEQCEVPQENLVGKENDSVAHMMRNLNIERITISGISLGIASACLNYVVKYAKERTQFNQPIANFQMVQERIAEMATRLDAGRALTYASAQAYDQGNREMNLGAESKLFAAQMATQAGLDAIQILGGYGYMKEYPVERYMRDAKLMEIGAGTNEVMRIIIAKRLLGLERFDKCPFYSLRRHKWMKRGPERRRGSLRIAICGPPPSPMTSRRTFGETSSRKWRGLGSLHC